MFFDPLFFLIAGPGFLMSMWAGMKTKSTFMKFSKVGASSGLTGAQAAQRLLDGAGIRDVEVVPARGTLTDHYNPKTKQLALSEPVFASQSIAAVGVACHEAGHAIQHAKNYGPLALRSLLVPTASLGGRFSFIVLIAGMMMNIPWVAWLGIGLFMLTILFQVVTLPVEFDASKRAKELAVQHGIVSPQENVGLKKVLNAAALTYVAAALTSVLTLFYLLVRFGMVGGRD